MKIGNPADTPSVAPATTGRTGASETAKTTPAAAPAEAEPVFNQLLRTCREKHASGVETGRFGAHMVISLVNDGPVTFLLRA